VFLQDFWAFRGVYWLQRSRIGVMNSVTPPSPPWQRSAHASNPTAPADYTAIIRIQKRKTIIYQEYKTFALRTAAVSWAKHREVELEKPGSSAARYTDARGLRAAKNVKELLVHPEITQEARSACRELRLVGKPRRRARRPAPDELARLREYFASRDRHAKIPMQAIVEFAIASAQREAEICRLEWRDNDAATRTGLVRDAKHPTSKEENHRRFKYTPEAWAIIESAPAGLLIAHPEVLGSYAARAGCWLRQTRLIAPNRCYSRY